MSERLRVIQNHLKPVFLAKQFNENHQSYTESFDYSALTKDQMETYKNNGYIIIKNLVDHKDIELYRQRFEDICKGKVTSLGMTLMYDVINTKSEFVDNKKAVSKLQDFQWDHILFQYCQLPQILNVIKSLIGENIMAMHTMLINKPPDTGELTSRHPMHQDLYYFPFRPADKIVCAWTAMQAINQDNGCLVVSPQSHNSPLLEHDYPRWEGGVNKLYHGIIDYNPDQNYRLHLNMEAGDTVFFHPLLIHGSGVNRTENFRKSISCHYAASDCEYVETIGTQQEKISGEIIEMIRKKVQSDIDVSFKDVWKHRSRLVAGKQINL